MNIYTSSKTESQKEGYKNFWDYSIVKVDGDFIPSWRFLADNNTATVYFEELAPTALYNGEIDVLSSTNITTGGYTAGYGNSRVYADKQAQTLNGVHRLKISLATSPSATIYYSDIFFDINNNIPVYVRLSSYEYIRVYRY
jgi:hypothetical protein